MSRKIFISFLGPTRYKPCSYYPEDDIKNPLPVEEFIQVSLLRLLHADFTEHDVIYIFLTKDAESKNWVDNGHVDFKTKQAVECEGLETKLNTLKKAGLLKADIRPVKNIPEGFSSEEIWELFSKLDQIILQGDQVYLDITHAFRYIPMLALSLMNFEQTVKDIALKSVYYGAFEKLGPVYEIEAKYPNPADRMAPIINLLSLEQLQQWSNATYEFEKKGDNSYLHQLTKWEINPILEKSAGKDLIAIELRKLNNALQNITQNIITNRGTKIFAGDHIDDAFQAINYLSKNGCFIKPVEALLKRIENKINGLENQNFPTWLNAARWCLQHDLIQQGITQLQEGIITQLILWARKKYQLFYQGKHDRELISQVLNITSLNIPKEEIVEYIISIKGYADLVSIYNKLTAKRNDINHGGYNQSSNKNPGSFFRVLETEVTKLEELFLHKFNRATDLSIKINKFINLSNHPISSWSAEQLLAAEKYGRLEDMNFPFISPESDKMEVEEMAEQYFQKLQVENSQYEVTIHLMGEQTFCYILIEKLKESGISVLASTTTREVIDEGNGVRKSIFRFVQFREY
jgi:CRISPR-associated Csx2 family protein